MSSHEYNDGHLWDQAWAQEKVTVDAQNPLIAMDRLKYRRLQPHLPPAPARTLEVGSGSARISTWLAGAGYRASCLDRSLLGLRAARANFQHIARPESLVIADGAESPFASGTFEVVLSTGLLEHFTDPQPIFNEMVRVLRPGGLFYSDIVPDKFSLFRALRFPRLKALLGRPEPFERSMSKVEIEGFMRAAGLSGVEVVPMGIFPPLLPGIWRLKPLLLSYRALSELKVWERFDGKDWAEPLAFYYFCIGRKAGSTS